MTSFSKIMVSWNAKGVAKLKEPHIRARLSVSGIFLDLLIPQIIVHFFMLK